MPRGDRARVGELPFIRSPRRRIRQRRRRSQSTNTACFVLADGVDRERLHEHLKLTERHLADGRRRLEHQRGVIERLRRDGHEYRALQGEKLLRTFEQLQSMNVSELARIREELARTP